MSSSPKTGTSPSGNGGRPCRGRDMARPWCFAAACTRPRQARLPAGGFSSATMRPTAVCAGSESLPGRSNGTMPRTVPHRAAWPRALADTARDRHLRRRRRRQPARGRAAADGPPGTRWPAARSRSGLYARPQRGPLCAYARGFRPAALPLGRQGRGHVRRRGHGRDALARSCRGDVFGVADRGRWRGDQRVGRGGRSWRSPMEMPSRWWAACRSARPAGPHRPWREDGSTSAPRGTCSPCERLA